jgi:hypothetical protein
MEDQKLSEQESLRIISEMIQKVKPAFYTGGTSAILWGSVVGIAGLVSFAQKQWDFSLPYNFDIWLLVLAAIIPQLFITLRKRKTKRVTNYQEDAMSGIWIAYAVGVFALVFYFNVIRGASESLIAGEGNELLVKNLQTGAVKHLRPFVLSQASLLLILYGIPTLATGIALKFRPMLAGAILCYVFFIISCFTANKYDYLFNGLAGITNWLVPGLILRKRQLKGNRC